MGLSTAIGDHAAVSRRSDAELAALAVAQLPCPPILVLDPERQVRFVRDPEAWSAALPRGPISVGASLGELGEEGTKLHEAAARALAGEPQRLELGGRSVALRPLRAGDEIVGVSAELSAGTDGFSERVRAAVALASGVGHEINNPLTYLFTNLDLLRVELDLRPEMTRARELYDETRVGAERMRAMVRTLKSLSEGATGKPDLISLGRVLEWAAQLTTAGAMSRAIFVVETPRPVFVRLREGLLMELLMLLLFDVAEALPASGGPHSVRLLLEPEEHEVAAPLIRVIPSVPWRAPSFTEAAALLSQLRLNLDLEQGLPVLRFPLAPPPASRPTPPPRAFTDPPPPAGNDRPSVLIIDDDPRVGSAIRRLLSHDANVSVMLSAEEALATLKNGRRFGLIICDLMMPGMTGMQFHEALQRELPEVLARVAYMTGGAFSQSARDFLSRVQNPRLEKPIDVDMLRGLVRQASD